TGAGKGSRKASVASGHACRLVCGVRHSRTRERRFAPIATRAALGRGERYGPAKGHCTFGAMGRGGGRVARLDGLRRQSGPSAAAAGGSAAGGQAGPAGGGGTAGGPVAGLPNGGATDIGVTADKIRIGGVWFHESYLDRYSRVAEHATRAFFNEINRAGGVF